MGRSGWTMRWWWSSGSASCSRVRCTLACNLMILQGLLWRRTLRKTHQLFSRSGRLWQRRIQKLNHRRKRWRRPEIPTRKRRLKMNPRSDQLWKLSKWKRRILHHLGYRLKLQKKILKNLLLVPRNLHLIQYLLRMMTTRTLRARASTSKNYLICNTCRIC